MILEGKNLAVISEKHELQCKYDLWCSKVRTSIETAGFTNSIQKEIKVKMHYEDFCALKNPIKRKERIHEMSEFEKTESMGFSLFLGIRS